MWDHLRHITSSSFSAYWAVAVWFCDAVLTMAIVHRVPFTNVDWETYMEQVDIVLAGQFDYDRVAGGTGPIAYPCGFCYIYGILRWLNLSLTQYQLIFVGLYLATLAIVLSIYRHAGAPGWLMVLCMLSKRTHSVFVLRFFNESVVALFFYLAILLFVSRRHWCGALAYSFSVSVKINPLLCCPAIGLHLVLDGGWSHAGPLVLFMICLQLVLAYPFLMSNSAAYFSRAFGGPGDLQQAWSVNWRFLPENIFYNKWFSRTLLAINGLLLVWFAQQRWIPFKQGFFDRQLRTMQATHSRLGITSTVALIFMCNFIGVACLRTIHFQYIAWYFHMVPFLAWYALQPEAHRGIAWASRCVLVGMLTMAVEVPFLLTTRGTVRGPDGRSWETDGVPTRLGSGVLQATHLVLIILSMCRPAVPQSAASDNKKK